MFVRFDQQGLRCRAVLVESMRVNGCGSPRLRHLAFIQSYREDSIASPGARACFWQGVRERLDELERCCRITGADRNRIEAALAAHVPPAPR